jgi:putative MATE family efflux protein
MATPTIMTMLVTSIYSITDTYFVGSLGTSATAAIGIAFPLMVIIQALGFFFGQGSGNYISRELGAMRVDNAVRMASTGFFASLIGGTAFAGICMFAIEPLALLLGSTPTILPHAIEYLRFNILGTPWMTGSLVLNNLLRYQGSAFFGMVGVVIGALINIALDPLFIFVFKMGVSGAALATMISQFISFLILLIACTGKSNLHISLKNFSPSARAFREMMSGGLPSLCRQGIGSVAGILINQFARGYGDAAIAAISIVQRVTMFSYSALIGFGQGFQPVCGFNFGAGRIDRMKRAFWFCVKVSAVFLTVLGVLIFLFSSQIVAIFRADDPEVIRIGSLALRLQALVYPLFGWAVLNNMMLQTTGKAFRSSVLSIARQGLFLLPALLIFVPLFGLLGLQISQPVADVGSFILAVPMYVSAKRDYDRLEAGPP